MILTKILTTDYSDINGLFSRKDTKNNSLREYRAVASSIRPKASFQLMPELRPHWLHQLFLVTQRDLRACQ